MWLLVMKVKGEFVIKLCFGKPLKQYLKFTERNTLFLNNVPKNAVKFSHKKLCQEQVTHKFLVSCI